MRGGDPYLPHLRTGACVHAARKDDTQQQQAAASSDQPQPVSQATRRHPARPFRRLPTRARASPSTEAVLRYVYVSCVFPFPSAVATPRACCRGLLGLETSLRALFNNGGKTEGKAESNDHLHRVNDHLAGSDHGVYRLHTCDCWAHDPGIFCISNAVPPFYLRRLLVTPGSTAHARVRYARHSSIDRAGEHLYRIGHPAMAVGCR